MIRRECVFSFEKGVKELLLRYGRRWRRSVDVGTRRSTERGPCTAPLGSRRALLRVLPVSWSSNEITQFCRILFKQ
jgi:hypothetical protein